MKLVTNITGLDRCSLDPEVVDRLFAGGAAELQRWMHVVVTQAVEKYLQVRRVPPARIDFAEVSANLTEAVRAVPVLHLLNIDVRITAGLLPPGAVPGEADPDLIGADIAVSRLTAGHNYFGEHFKRLAAADPHCVPNTSMTLN